MATSFDVIDDRALIHINDYKLEKSVETMSKENFDLLQKSINYDEYKSNCEAHTPDFLLPVSSKRYDYIKAQEYLIYDDYVADMEKYLVKKLDAFLVTAIPSFDNCSKMDSADYDIREFKEDLSNTEISILADLTILSWYVRENNDIRGQNAMIMNKSEARRHSEANLLKERTFKEIVLTEKVDTRITKYDLKNNFKVGSWGF